MYKGNGNEGTPMIIYVVFVLALTLLVVIAHDDLEASFNTK